MSRNESTYFAYSSSGSVAEPPHIWKNELEQQLVLAETRCDTLKQQLDCMKMLYQGSPQSLSRDKMCEKLESTELLQQSSLDTTITCMKSAPSLTLINTELNHINSLENQPIVTDLTQLEGTHSEVSMKGNAESKCLIPNSSKSQCEGTSAVKVIQDILCGISDSVNRISKFNIDDISNEQKLNSDNSVVNVSDETYQTFSDDKNEYRRGSTKTRKQQRFDSRQHPLRNINFSHVCESVESIQSVTKRKGRKNIRYHNQNKGAYRHMSQSVIQRHSNKLQINKQQSLSKEKRIHVQGSNLSPRTGVVKIKSSIEPTPSPVKVKRKHGKPKLSRSNTIGSCDKSESRISELTDHLVELYHNMSARPTTSTSEDFPRHRERKLYQSLSRMSNYMSQNEEDAISVERLVQSPDIFDIHSVSSTQIPSTHSPLHPPPKSSPAIPSPPPPPPPPPPLPPAYSPPIKISHEDRDYLLSTHKKFQQPTISSKMKQATKPFIPHLNFRNIPFVVGKSTSPSHNLGLNIQQAMSILKAKHHPAGRTPLILAENYMHAPSILSTGGLSRPGTTTSSHVTGIHRNYCPVAAACHSVFHPTSVRDVTDNNATGDALCIGNSQTVSDLEPQPECFEKLSTIHYETPFLSEHMMSRSQFRKDQQADKVWNVEQDDELKGQSPKLRCTCFPSRQCIDYQKLLSQYLESGEGMSFFQLVQSPPVPCLHSVNQSRRFTPSGKSVIGTVTVSESRTKLWSHGLKDVLINLHNDFLRLNTKYEEVHNGIHQEIWNERDTLRELEGIESELQTKEDEITVVMTLYREVMSLKNQVKALKHHAGTHTSTNKASRVQNMMSRQPTISIRLTQLLRTVQQFQDKIRDNA